MAVLSEIFAEMAPRLTPRRASLVNTPRRPHISANTSANISGRRHTDVTLTGNGFVDWSGGNGGVHCSYPGEALTIFYLPMHALLYVLTYSLTHSCVHHSCPGGGWDRSMSIYNLPTELITHLLY